MLYSVFIKKMNTKKYIYLILLVFEIIDIHIIIYWLNFIYLIDVIHISAGVASSFLVGKQFCSFLFKFNSLFCFNFL